MSVVVVATSTPRAGHVADVVEAFRAVADLVHAEQGCEMYAVHHNDTRVVVVERWTTQADLDAHANGAAIAELQRLVGDLADGGLAELLVLEADPFGDAQKGIIG